jgi:cytoskeletal protein CcmA (bactofilin family)
MNFLMSSCIFAESFGKDGVKGRRVAAKGVTPGL